MLLALLNYGIRFLLQPSVQGSGFGFLAANKTICESYINTSKHPTKMPKQTSSKPQEMHCWKNYHRDRNHPYKMKNGHLVNNCKPNKKQAK
tara:strand:+ start:258 stop:530 length:273 start_codon:yes stop_codon:yes gene_type:complete